MYELKFTQVLCVMAMKNNAKSREQLTCYFKRDMRNLTNFDSLMTEINQNQYSKQAD